MLVLTGSEVELTGRTGAKGVPRISAARISRLSWRPPRASCACYWAYRRHLRREPFGMQGQKLGRGRAGPGWGWGEVRGHGRTWS